ncbi:HAD family phosphatase [Candidatus Uhrbacteria bacterium]|nr:HAD family phosphatase [Candidatus Uhrbacteria bacterium]
MPPKAVIFDLNGVFIQSPKLSDRFRDDFGVPPEEFLPALKSALTQARLPGGVDVYTSMRPHLERWGITHTKEEFFHYWFSAEHEVPAMADLARSLRAKGIRVLILSNNFPERSAYYADFPFVRDAVDTVYYSWQIGYPKSDPRAYQVVLEREGLRPDECIFFDDQQENVRIAQSLGIASHVFSGIDGVRGVLASSGVL